MAIKNEWGLWINYDKQITKQIEGLNIGETVSFDGQDSFCRETINTATHTVKLMTDDEIKRKC